MITVYTDGGCKSNPNGAAAWGCCFFYDNSTIVMGHHMGTGSSNAAELEAVIQALNHLLPGTHAEIYSDSMYVVNTINKSWNIRANRKRWKQIFDLLQIHPNITFHWVKGHKGNEGNELADLAVNYYLNRKLTKVQCSLIDKYLVGKRYERQTL